MQGLALGKKHILPHVKEIGKSVLLDALEGRNVGSSIKNTHKKQSCQIITKTLLTKCLLIIKLKIQ